MDYTYFLFAFFIFILTIAAIFLWKKIKGSKDNYAGVIAEKEKKLFKLYQSLEDMIAGAMEFIEDAQNEVAQDKTKTENALKSAKELLEQVKKEAESIKASEPNAKSIGKAYVESQEYNKPVLISNKLNRNEQVLLLKKEGQNVKQISKVLGMSQSEVSLIIGLNR